MKKLNKKFLTIILAIFSIFSFNFTVYGVKCSICGRETSNEQYCNVCLTKNFTCLHPHCTEKISDVDITMNFQKDPAAPIVLCHKHWLKFQALCRRCHKIPFDPQSFLKLCKTCDQVCSECGKTLSPTEMRTCEDCLTLLYGK